MKKPNQIERKNSSGSSSSQGKKLKTKAGDVRKLSELEIIQLDQLYCLYSEQSFTDGMACFAGLAELTAGNTAPEIQALKRMVAAEQELNGIRSKAMAV